MNPRSLGSVRGLKGADFVVALQCQRDFIKALKQPRPTARINLETMPLSRRRGDRLFLEIDADASCALGKSDLRGKPVDNLLVDDNREDSVLKTVGVEDIAEAGADNRADSHFLQRPYRPFSGRTAAEIWTGNKDFCLPIR